MVKRVLPWQLKFEEKKLHWL